MTDSRRKVIIDYLGIIALCSGLVMTFGPWTIAIIVGVFLRNCAEGMK